MSNSFRDLLAWQQAMELVVSVYRHTKRFPADERFGLTSQLRRAAVSVPSNIAEGQGRSSAGEFVQFLGNAKGSLHEVQTQIDIASALEYLNAEEATMLLEKCDRVERLLSGLTQSMRLKLVKKATAGE